MKKTEIEARSLVLKFMQPIDELHKYPMCFDTAKQCALILVKEIINLMINVFKWDENNNGNIEYFKEVEYEIKNL